MKRLFALLMLGPVVGMSGCTAQQLYASGQSWQRNECFKLLDNIQRDQCLQRTWMPYDQYQRELHADARRAQLQPPR